MNMNKIIDIDRETLPFCLIKEKSFEWGEIYQEYIPIFQVFFSNENLSLEESILFLGENNFKQQLRSLHNVIVNNEEFERIENYCGEEFNRAHIISKINFYIEKNENLISPWEKYDLGLQEIDFINMINYEMNKKMYYVKE
ncbi:hypothetical protein RCZ01_18340 [Capnocytophaga felis]|uniref:Uncharacterized protein n=2 Tax=Capnocytophaga felis TaxID=2267611 RepID=A0A5M4BB37_9FLAO|nr:hypothetical protein RCZ01_18340 [Capnocytophaga felis]GET49006.1 hypothetical protein RCZ02_18370 [Capnocytophaga felis]